MQMWIFLILTFLNLVFEIDENEEVHVVISPFEATL